MRDDIRQAGLSYIERGWAVIPLHHMIEGRCSCAYGPKPSTRDDHDFKQGGKHPMATRWPEQAQRAPAGWDIALQVAEREYGGSNVGIVTGTPSGIWVLDVDTYNGGGDSLAALEREHGELPRTYTVMTGSTSTQRYWKLPADGFVPTTSPGRLPPGLDVRGNGGQVVAPPSVSGKGPYSVMVDFEPIYAPEWLLSYIRPAPPREPTPYAPMIPGSYAAQLDPYANDARLSSYAASAVSAELAKLAYAPVGSRRRTAYGVACSLIELLNSPWALLDESAVMVAYSQAARTAIGINDGGSFDEQEGASAWLAAARNVGGRERELPAELMPQVVNLASLPPAPPPFDPAPGGGALNGKSVTLSETRTLTLSDGVAMPAMPGLTRAGDYGDTWAPAWQPPPSLPPAAELSAPDSWQPVDMTLFTDGSYEAPEPSLGWRSDGQCLLYQGKEHLIMGESESGKTWWALWIIKDCLLKGYPCVIVDFEDDAGTFASRLMLLGVPASVLNNPALFAYVSPDRSSTPADIARLLAIRPYVVLFDGKTEGYGLHGWKINDNDDAAKWRRSLVAPFTRAGVATMEVAHVPKGGDADARGPIGSVHQLNGINGVVYRVAAVEPFAPGRRGVSRVSLSKDRPGGVKKHLEAPEAGKLWHVGTFILDTTVGAEYPGAAFFAPRTRLSDTETDEFGLPVGEDAPDKLAVHKQAVAGYLAGFIQDGVNTRVLRDAVPGKATLIDQALAELIRDGFVTTTEGPRRVVIHFLSRPWSAAAQKLANEDRGKIIRQRFKPSAEMDVVESEMVS